LHFLSKGVAFTRRHKAGPAAMAAAIGVLLFTGFALYDYRSALKRTEERVAVTSRTLAAHADTVLQSAQLVLELVAARVADEPWPKIHKSPDLHIFLTSIQRRYPQVESIFLVDRDGQLAATSRVFPSPAFDAQQREYFREAEKAPLGSAPHVSAPFKSALAGTYAFTISAPIHRRGKFDGLAAVTVYPGYFNGFYNATLTDPGATTASLVRTADGAVLIRHPATAESMKQLPPTSPLLQALASGQPSGIYQGISSVDGNTRITGFQKLSSFPLTATYNVDRSFVLAGWYKHLILFAAFSTLFSVLLFVAMRSLLKQSELEQEKLALQIAQSDLRHEAEHREQHAHKLESLARLSGGIAHDFNNVLAAILAAVQLVSKKTTDERSLRQLDAAAEAARRGARLTSQMLAFARPQETRLAPLDAKEALDRMSEALSRTAGELVSTSIQIEPDLWLVQSDEAQLDVALINLVANARDALPFGGRLAISAANVEVREHGEILGLVPGSYVAITVEDDGEGMSEEVRRKAPEPFFTTRPRAKASGLGLSMVHGFAKQAGGGIDIVSRPGEGTKVRVFLRKADSLPEQVAASDDVRTDITGRIFLVDDDDAVRQLLADTLEGYGHSVRSFASGAEALAALDSSVDLLIADFTMPVMDGSELATKARRVFGDLPIVFISGHAEEGALESWAASGCSILHKPFTDAELQAVVQGALRPGSQASNIVQLRH
jgi:two-component system, NtrC family, sensor kinase